MRLRNGVLPDFATPLPGWLFAGPGIRSTNNWEGLASKWPPLVLRMSAAQRYSRLKIV